MHILRDANQRHIGCHTWNVHWHPRQVGTPTQPGRLRHGERPGAYYNFWYYTFIGRQSTRVSREAPGAGSGPGPSVRVGTAGSAPLSTCLRRPMPKLSFGFVPAGRRLRHCESTSNLHANSYRIAHPEPLRCAQIVPPFAPRKYRISLRVYRLTWGHRLPIYAPRAARRVSQSCGRRRFSGIMKVRAEGRLFDIVIRGRGTWAAVRSQARCIRANTRSSFGSRSSVKHGKSNWRSNPQIQTSS